MTCISWWGHWDQNLNVTGCNGGVGDNIWTHHVGKIPFQRVTHKFQGAACCLVPLVLPLSEPFTILCHHVDKYYGAIHCVMEVQPVGGHIEYHLLSRQHHSETVPFFAVEDDSIFPGSAGQGEYVCCRLWVVPYTTVYIEFVGLFHLYQPCVAVEGDRVVQILDVCHHCLVWYDVNGALDIEQQPADQYNTEFSHHLRKDNHQMKYCLRSPQPSCRLCTYIRL